MPSQQQGAKFDLSGGVQSATSRLLARNNEMDSARNATFNYKIGSAARRLGYEQLGTTVQHGKDGLGAYVYKYDINNKIIAVVNNSGDTATSIRYLDTGNWWTEIFNYPAANVKTNAINFLDEFYVCGYSKGVNYYAPIYNINSALNASSTRNTYGAPAARFISEFQGRLYAINVKIGDNIYRDRVYLSSAATGFITRVQNDQVGLLQQLQVDSVRYLKAGMAIDIYTGGTNAKIVDSLTIVSVDKKNNKITFSPTTVNVKDNDELWLEDRKGKLSVLWNTDYPTPESADYLRIPPGIEQNPEITGYGKSTNRIFFFTRNSAWKWDGANLVNVSENIGCTSHGSIKNIGSWIIWLHTSGVWGYNDSTGQLKLLSRAVDNYIKAISQYGLENASAAVVDRVYKLGVGEIAELDSITTSTSTSSTSTSSTSTSTSSTSTSSTSTSSTSTSSTQTTTSTSSTSSSTSSTSTSSTSVSTSSTSSSSSTSTSSTTTQTIASTKNVVRIVYDFDMNSWWFEYHKREFRYHFNHTMHGYTKPYFQDETGRIFRDEIGDLDHFDTIPFELELGREDQGSRYKKKYDAIIVESENARGTQVAVAIERQQYKNIGQITEDIQQFTIPSDFRFGRDINVKFTHNDAGERPVINGYEVFYSLQEMKIG